MDEGKFVDARGLSCPQPIMMVRKTLQESGGGVVSAVVDTMTQVENCARASKNLGWTVTYEEKEDCYEMEFEKRA